MDNQLNERKKHIVVILVIVLIFLLGGEAFGRWYGFCNSPLYYNNEYSGYNLVPNQDVKRFRNHYITNEYSMRSEPLNDGEYRITLVGDSVLNGGVQTDHENLASTLLENDLQDKYGNNLRVLNVSCGGWGIDNAMGVFKEYGDFESQMIILVFNSHDAVGTISEKPVAGNSKNFPIKQYPLAWIELFDRYLIPRVESKLNIKSNVNVNDTNTSSGNDNSKGWDYFYRLCQKEGIPLVIYLHATKEEHFEGEYDENGKWIMKFAEERDIPFFTDIDEVSEEDYRDSIHLSESGQQVIYDILDPFLVEFLDNTYQ